MMEIIETRNNQAVTTSLNVSKTFGKQHKHVLESIQNIVAENSAAKSFFALGSYKSRGRKYKMYYMNKDGFTLLAMSFTGKKAMEFKMEYINAFNQMEAEIKQQSEHARLPQSPEELLELTIQVASRTEHRVSNIEDDVNELKNNVLIDSGSYQVIGREVARKVYRYLDDRNYPHTSDNTSSMFADINHGIKQITGVKTRSRIKNKDFDKVMAFIDAWEPATATRTNLTKKEMAGAK